MKKADQSGGFGRVDWRMTLSDDRRRMRIEIIVDEKIVAQHDADALDLDDLIRGFARGRASLVDEIPTELEQGSHVRRIERPYVLVKPIKKDGTRELVIRDPAYGWTGFVLDEEDARDLSVLLWPPPNA